MLELLTGASLALAAGLNAYIPLLAIGLLSRFTDFIALPTTWSWIESDIALIVIGVLLVIELIADKIPAVDTVNDVIQTIIRPASGGIVFGSGANASTVAVADPSAFFENNQWVPVAIGVGLALITHLVKTGFRIAATAMFVGFASPLLSTFEDGVSAVGSFLALFAPVLAALLLIGAIIGIVMLWRKRKEKTRQNRAVANLTGS
ncbi:DUF4126 domain-containing protein [Lysinibacter cavernae]|uniref:Putative membrane protein n=1 Tax=Lysinibacter cavernae TaxID=1640652 RepID=A0A7X5QZJ6_9MICO|nr:DUF4126 domain-containing protein [Lysinibacter cavernae]NIH52843.1 putative membrane protein [Lysinibacter cavernae]